MASDAADPCPQRRRAALDPPPDRPRAGGDLLDAFRGAPPAPSSGRDDNSRREDSDVAAGRAAAGRARARRRHRRRRSRSPRPRRRARPATPPTSTSRTATSRRTCARRTRGASTRCDARSSSSRRSFAGTRSSRRGISAKITGADAFGISSRARTRAPPCRGSSAVRDAYACPPRVARPRPFPTRASLFWQCQKREEKKFLLSLFRRLARAARLASPDRTVPFSRPTCSRRRGGVHILERARGRVVPGAPNDVARAPQVPEVRFRAGARSSGEGRDPPRRRRSRRRRVQNPVVPSLGPLRLRRPDSHAVREREIDRMETPGTRRVDRRRGERLGEPGDRARRRADGPAAAALSVRHRGQRRRRHEHARPSVFDAPVVPSRAACTSRSWKSTPRCDRRSSCSAR